MRPLAAPAHLTLLMSFIGENTIHLQTMLITLTGKCMAFQHIETTSLGDAPGNIKYNT